MSKVTFICGGEQVPASRFRVDPVATGLREQGWSVNTHYGYGALDHRLGSGTLRRAYRASCRIRRAAVTACLQSDGPVVVQRLAWPWWGAPEARLASNSAGLVFDFDDAVFLNSSGTISSLRDAALRKVFRASRVVVAGNSWLASYASDDADVVVIPTCIDTEHYMPKPSPEGKVVVGWIGTSGNFKYLSQLIEPLAELRREGMVFDFVICSDVKNDALFQALEARYIKWSAESEIATIQSFDIGLMPLFDDDWCRGKCSFKLIQYAAVGLPSVGSSVGFNKDVIESGVTGYLVESINWFEPLRALISDYQLRQSMGENARALAVQRFDISIAVSAYKALLAKIG